MQKSKKLMSVLLTLVMLLSLVPTTAYAVNQGKVTIESKNVNAGDSFDVEVSIAEHSGFANFQLAVEYDNSMLELTAINKGAVLDGSFTKNPSKGLLVFAGEEDITEDGVLATLTFKAKESASGTTSVTLKPTSQAPALKEFGFSNVDDSPVPVTFVPGTITVKANTTDRTVQFMNGDSVVESATVANGGTLTSIPDAPDAALAMALKSTLSASFTFLA